MEQGEAVRRREAEKRKNEARRRRQKKRKRQQMFARSVMVLTGAVFVRLWRTVQSCRGSPVSPADR